MLGNTQQWQLGLWLPFEKSGNNECSTHSKSFHPIADVQLVYDVGGVVGIFVSSWSSFLKMLRPVPPGSGKDPDSRWNDIYEDAFDEEQFAEWVPQAAALPGWDLRGLPQDFAGNFMPEDRHQKQ